MGHKRRALLVLSAALALGALPAGEATLRVEWSVHDGCPGPDFFWAEVSARSPRVRAAAKGDDAHVASIDVVREGSRSVGTFTLDGGAARTVAAATCEEAFRALAIVAVVALDAPAQAPPVDEPTASASATPAPTVSSSLADESGAFSSAESAVPPRSTRWLPAIGVVAGVLGAGAGTIVTTGLALDLERATSRPGPSLRLHFDRGRSTVLSADRGTGAAFTWTTGSLDGCIALFTLAPSIVARGCVTMEGGVLRGEPTGVVDPSARSRPWLAAYLVPRLQWALGSVVYLELDGALGAALLRDQFIFDPGIPVFRSSPIVGRARLSLLVRFP